MKSKLILLLVLSTLFAMNYSGFAQEIAEGLIYADINQNGTKDKKEPGIENVSISNGRDVVLTSQSGKYQIELIDGDILFVIKPDLYTFPLNEYKLPQFYYIHKPNGSPELKYKGSWPTGKLPKSIDFALYPIKKKKDFRMLVFGDPQPYTEEEVDFFYRGIIKELEGIEGVDFGLSMGDLVGNNLDLFSPYKNAVKHLGIPWHNVIGNHDMNLDVEIDRYSNETFESHFGPSDYAFNHGQVHFIILDDILYPDPRDKKGYWGGLLPEQLEFIENDLKTVPKDKLIVLAFHIPISENDGNDTYSDESLARLFELLKDFPYTLTISAHTHCQSQDFFSQDQGWLQNGMHHHFNVGTTSGSWYTGKLNEQGIPISTMRDGTRKGYAFINFSGNQYTIDYKVAGYPADYQMEIHAPKVIRRNEHTSAGIAANFFIGSKFDTLVFRVDNGDWKKMWHVKTLDPAYLNTVLEWDFVDTLPEGSRPSNPVDCTHIWFSKIPVDLEAGMHTIEVKAKDMFGREHRQKKEYRIVED